MDAAETQCTHAVGWGWAVLLRKRLLFLRAAVRAADAIHRVQGREDDERQSGEQLTHPADCTPLAAGAIGLTSGRGSSILLMC